MGLDNGIVAQGISKSDIPNFVHLPFECVEEDQDTEHVIAYWRKCYGVREAILSVLHGAIQDHTNIDAEDLPAIRRALVPFMSKEHWESEGDSIWEFEEIFESLLHDLINLFWLEQYMRDHPEVKCYFYDSF